MAATPQLVRSQGQARHREICSQSRDPNANGDSLLTTGYAPVVPRIALLSTSDTDLLSARGSGADYVVANPARSAHTELAEVLEACDLIVARVLGSPQLLCSGFDRLRSRGKPMVVLPVFWDQYDNAQRVAEKGFGRRLATYEFDDTELAGAIDGLLADVPLRRRMSTLAASIQARDGLRRAAELIESVAMRPVLSPVVYVDQNASP